MTDQFIENLLRKAPAPKAPAELREILIAGIRLTGAEPARPVRSAGPSWFKRWLPALSFAVFLLACVVVIAVQINQLAALRRENETLRAHNQNMGALRDANAEVRRLRNENAELGRLRKNDAEIQRLRDEVMRLRAQTEGLAQLRAENARLQAAANATSGAQPDFFADEQRRAERIACVNNLKQIGVAERVWANDHNGQYPGDFASMSNEIKSLNFLQCPSDKSRHITSWAQVAAGDVSYQIFTDGLSDKDNPSTIVLECPIHHNLGLLDGSVQQINDTNSRLLLKVVDGRRVFAPSAP